MWYKLELQLGQAQRKLRFAVIMTIPIKMFGLKIEKSQIFFGPNKIEPK